jgi:hypothetical protein
MNLRDDRPLPELWFADFDGHYTGEGADFCSAEDEVISEELEARFREIWQEVAFIWETEDGAGAFASGYDAFDDKQFPQGSWKKLVFKVWGLSSQSARKRFKVIDSLLQEHECRITSCQIARLAPGAVIKPHCGETNAILRIHLGLRVPEVPAEECGIRVGRSVRRWEEGKALCFVDAEDHEVWNRSDSYRYILIVDVIRIGFQRQKSLICARIIVSQLLFMVMVSIGLRRVAQGMPKSVLSTLAYLALYPVKWVTSFHNSFRIFNI